ncbi:prolyl oligopeptidase family serine peptidase [Alkalihalobacillus sp. AL-G]|uniref:prolyl oligopeptidase family serine peptidase n=1 Tax=Alkalihalobacillus sp. AL-G TaxID=2926399 RepID=UPI00272B91AB|nr:prolyl oligopeptidase family serine peptidase [Alkalihalobacillus sp. AL-G]WLD94885.1 prolyl oligopeptidase family serine peptidase [Alkalihalobacillus sp. AL-G]
MVLIHNERIEDEIPVLNVAKKEAFAEELPTVIFLHGITSSKEQNLSYAYLLAELGYRTILPDFPYHGERMILETTDELQFRFWDIVLKGIAELKLVAGHYIGSGQTDESRIGVAGTSMGSITMFGALTQYEWIKTAVSLMGTPCYEQFATGMIDTLQKEGKRIPYTEAQISEKLAALRPFDLSIHPGLLAERPLLIWHGQKDPIVPYSLTRKFYERVKEIESINTSKVKMITDPNAGHKVTRDACHATVRWFKSYL